MTDINITETNSIPALSPELPHILLNWYDHNARDLLWRRDKDPYRVWVSEIMLQQTGVEVVSRYYPRFLNTFPTVAALAGSDVQLLLKLWEGLGYYTRVRNMQRAARMIMELHSGRFPETYTAIRSLPGIGAYTAGAIASICFDQPTPAVDGNVIRVITRIAGIGAEITDRVKKNIGASLKDIYPADRPGDFTQSLMDLGAVVCIPNGAPNCSRCPAAALCVARREGTAAFLPRKTPKAAKKLEEHTVFLLKCGDVLALRHREESGLLGGLWELPNVPGLLCDTDAVRQAEAWGVRPSALLRSRQGTHIFTHIRWEMICYAIECREMCPDFTWVRREELREKFSLPTAFRKFLDDGLQAPW